MVRPLEFLRETQDELTKVVWPTRTETVRLTFIVIFISLVVGLYIGGLDFLFTKATEIILK